MNETYKPLTVLTFDFTKLYLATMLIKSSTVQNGVSIKSPQITHFALTFSYSFIYQNFWKTINNGVLLINNGTAVLSRLRQAYQLAVTNPSTRSPLRHSSAERSACHLGYAGKICCQHQRPTNRGSLGIIIVESSSL